MPQFSLDAHNALSDFISRIQGGNAVFVDAKDYAALEARVAELEAAPAIDLKQFRESVEAEYASVASRHLLNGAPVALMMEAEAKRQRLLALIDGSKVGSDAPAPAAQQTDCQYQTPDDLIEYLASVMDDGGQGGEVWPPAKAAIAGILAWQAGDEELPTLCDLCNIRPEVRTDAEGVPSCQECWDGRQDNEQVAVGGSKVREVQP